MPKKNVFIRGDGGDAVVTFEKIIKHVWYKIGGYDILTAIYYKLNTTLLS